MEGSAKEPSGGVLPGGTVEASSASGAIQSTVTDARGVYHFPALPPGTYSVKASLSGFRPAKSENLKVSLGDLLSVDLTLSPGVSQSVEVRAEAPKVDVKQSAVTQI